MSEEYKELQIGANSFRIRFYRSFKAQCDILRLKRDLEPDDIVKADCQVKVLDYDNKGQVQGEKWVPITDDSLERLSSDDGLKLYNEVIDYRLKKKESLQKSEPEVLTSVSKTDGSGKEGSGQSALKN